MALNSALYNCKVMHNRITPKKHRFVYKVFMFWLDVDELPLLHNTFKFISHNQWNVFSCYDKDHFKYPKGDERNNKTIRENLKSYLINAGKTELPHKVYLLTNLRILGYVFNPVSFYYCYNASGNCIYVIAEISNTYHEMKLFLIDTPAASGFKQQETKYFYVSPFIDLDAQFNFKLNIPADRLQVNINVEKENQTFFFSTLTGIKKSLTQKLLILYFFKFPFITLKIIGAIHYQAFLLWLKKIRYHPKNEHQELQRNIINSASQQNIKHAKDQKL